MKAKAAMPSLLIKTPDEVRTKLIIVRAVRRPIAVIDSGLPIEEVIARLNAVQVDHPGAQVRRGTGNSWEIWPPDEA